MSDSPPFNALVSRRLLLAGLSSLPLLSLPSGAAARGKASAPGFKSIRPTKADKVTVPSGYEARVLISWGDPLFPGMQPVNLNALTRAEQERRFGQGNDMLAIFPAASRWPVDWAADSYMLCVNHELLNLAMLAPAAKTQRDVTAAIREGAVASMGVSVLTIARDGRRGWRLVFSDANRRITPFTPVQFTGPAANHRWVKSAAAFIAREEGAASDGTIGCGTMANCAGGRTPWGTYLSAEENFNNFHFAEAAESDDVRTARKDAAHVLDASSFGYALFGESNAPFTIPRLDVRRNPTGPALYGWIVEIDPYDPDWAPRKHTALGRRKSECATTALTRDQRVAVYSGDDQVNEFVYKFVSKGRFNPADRKAARTLLSEGQLYAAQFHEDGSGAWLPITLAAANKAAKAAEYPPLFTDEGDLMMRAREAARLIGATPMDRPEDVETVIDQNWVGDGTVLVVCTGNPEQGFARPGNPRRGAAADGGKAQPNTPGHIVRIDEAGGDCGATRFSWNVFALGGDPDAAAETTPTPNFPKLAASTEVNGARTLAGERLACPDNLMIDSRRNVWVTTDGADEVWGDGNDGVYCVPLDASGPKPLKRFLVGPMGSEICGPAMTPDEKTFFCCVQHPGDADEKGVSFTQQRWSGERSAPASTFPDGGWPRASIVYVTRKDGKEIWA